MMVCLRKFGALSFLVLLLVLTPTVLGASKYVNITITETVDQIVYFAETSDSMDENQSYFNITGLINISNVGADTVSDLWINLTYTHNISVRGTINQTFNNISGRECYITGSIGSIVTFHIPELLAGEGTIIDYEVNTSSPGVKPPLNITTSYNGTQKIVSGENWTIMQNATNDFSDTLYDVTIVEEAQIVTDPDGNFTILSVSGPDSSNASIDESTNMTLTWNVSAHKLDSGEVAEIILNVMAPTDVPQSQSYAALNCSLEYKINGTISLLTVDSIMGVGEAWLNLSKQIVQSVNSTHVDWNVTPKFGTNSGLEYNVTKVFTWVTPSYDPNNMTEQLNNTENPCVTVTAASHWAGSGWIFNYTDVPTPIVWADADFRIRDDGTQQVFVNTTTNGTDVYVKYIYIMMGYWLEISKTITSAGSNTYNITLDVYNRGTESTPYGAEVAIYDFVPEEFNATNFSFSRALDWTNTTNSTVNGSMGYNGTAYKWAIDFIAGTNHSFLSGARYGVNVNTTFQANYTVTGIGEYDLKDVYIVGLDPFKVDSTGDGEVRVSPLLITRSILLHVDRGELILVLVASVALLLNVMVLKSGFFVQETSSQKQKKTSKESSKSRS